MSKEVSNTTEVIEQVVETTPTEIVDVAEKVAEKESFIKKNKWTLIGATALAATAALIGGLAYKRFPSPLGAMGSLILHPNSCLYSDGFRPLSGQWGP